MRHGRCRTPGHPRRSLPAEWERESQPSVQCYSQTVAPVLETTSITQTTDLCHDNVLTLLDELVLGLDNGLQKLEILDMPTMRLSTVDKVLNHTLVNLAAELEVIHEDVLHGDSLQDLGMKQKRTYIFPICGILGYLTL